jgi:hypothetical protein
MSEPYCLAMVLCDAVHRDPATGKCTILGTFGTVNDTTYPAQLSFYVYHAITDVQGEHNIKFQIVDSSHGFEEDSEPIVLFDNILPSPASPLAVIEGIMGIQNAQIPKPGVYHCELLCDNAVLMSRRLVARQIQKSGE